VTIDDLSFQIIGAAMEVHTDVGPGLTEKPYDACFGDQLTTLGLQFEHQVHFPVMRAADVVCSPRFASITSCARR
jgi:GxxExxY protein